MEKSQRLDSSTLSKLTPQELKLYKLYGKLPNKKDLLNYKLKDNRKFFDSGDYHMKKEKEKHPSQGETNIPIHKPEQIKTSRRMSSTVDMPLEDFTKSHLVSESKVETLGFDGSGGNADVKLAGNNGRSPRARSNSLLNPQQNAVPQSPLTKQP